MEMDISGKSQGEISTQDQNDPVQVDKSRPTPIPRKSFKKPNWQKLQVPFLEELRGKLQIPAKPKPPVMPKPPHLVKILPVSSDNGSSETSEMKSPTAALAPDKTTMSSKALKEVPLLTSSSTSPSSCSSSSESEMAKKVVNRKNMDESSLCLSEIKSLSNERRAVPEEQNVKHGTSKSADAAEKSQPESTLSFRDKLKLFNKCGNYNENHSGLEGGNKFERDAICKDSVKAKLSNTSIWGKVSTQSEVTSYHHTATAASQESPALKALKMPLKAAATEAPAREMANEGVAVAQGSSVPLSRESRGNEAADEDCDVGLKEFVSDDSTEEWNNENFSLHLDTQTSSVLYQNLCEQKQTHNPCTEWIDSPFDYVSSIDFIHTSDNSDNTELKYDDELPYDKYSSKFSPLGIPFSPQDFGSEMLGYSNARGRQSDMLEKEWLKQENEKLKKENETLKKQTTIQVPVRPYRLRLLKTLATECRICKVTLFLQEGMVEFHGLEEDCESARWTFLMFLQDLAEDSLQVSTSISSILQSESGRSFMENLCKLHPACSLETEDGCVKCAAVKMRDVQTCLDDLRRKICQKTCKENDEV